MSTSKEFNTLKESMHLCPEGRALLAEMERLLVNGEGLYHRLGSHDEICRTCRSEFIVLRRGLLGELLSRFLL